MQVFGFDLVAYPEHFDHLKVSGELPYPLPKQYFRPELAVRNYREHLEAWALMEELGDELLRAHNAMLVLTTTCLVGLRQSLVRIMARCPFRKSYASV